MTIHIQTWSSHVTRRTRLYRMSAIVAIVTACAALPTASQAQSSSNAAQGTGSRGGFTGLGASHGGSGFGLNAGPMGSPSALGGLSAGSGAGRSGAGGNARGAMAAPPAISGSVPASGRPASKSNQPSIGSQLSAGPYAGARPSGLGGAKASGPSLADKLKQGSATASAGKSKQWNYTYGSENVGTSAVYKSPYKSTTADYQWGADSH